MHHYHVEIGSVTLRMYGDDQRTRARVSRWIRLFWARRQTQTRTRYAGSMADSTDNGWHKPPTCTIYRSAALLPGFIIPSAAYQPIDHFELSPDPLAEFHRVATVPRADAARIASTLAA